MTYRDLIKMKQELSEAACKEAYRLWRFARQCQKRGVSPETCKEIREEAWWLHSTCREYPERLLDFNFNRDHKWAFQLGGTAR